MTVTTDRRTLYENMTPKEKDVIDEAFSAAYAVLKSNGLPVSGDDRGETLVGAIARFVEDSKR